MASHFDSFEKNLKVIVIGATGGLGKAFVSLLSEDKNVEHIHALSRSSTKFESQKVTEGAIDIREETSVEQAASLCLADGPADIILVTTGFLHNEAEDIWPEKALRDISTNGFANAFAINTVGPALIAKHFLKNLDKGRPCLFAAISARVGSISDNQLGGWYAYRASKAALNMVLKTTSIEIRRKYKKAMIVGLHPGTVDTSLSKPFQGHVPNGKLFTPEHSARHLLNVINTLKPENSGNTFAWDGTKIDF
ncbi:MAG: SDR family NAD(P)-dependent oxidoreductase [Pseudomonadota bacterium]